MLEGTRSIWFHAQDHDKTVAGKTNDLEFRRLAQAARYSVTAKGANPDTGAEPTEDSKGPIHGLLLWEPEDFQQNPPVWSFVFPIVTKVTDPGASPPEIKIAPIVGDDGWGRQQPDRKLEDAVYPLNLRYPAPWSGLTVNGQDYDAQNPMTMPAFQGLVAPFRDGSRDMGTRIFELTAQDEIDFNRMAHLQSAWRVVRTTDNACEAYGKPEASGFLAWQLGSPKVAATPQMGAAPTPLFYAGHGACADDPLIVGTVARGANFPQTIAFASRRLGGPLHAGLVGDKHRITINDDLEPYNPLHITTKALFIDDRDGFKAKDPDRDAPLDFGGDWEDPNRAPHLTLVHLRYDDDSNHTTPCGNYKGLWRWEAETVVSIILEPRKPPTDVLKSKAGFGPGGGPGAPGGAPPGGAPGGGAPGGGGGGPPGGGGGGGFGSRFGSEPIDKDFLVQGASNAIALPSLIGRPQLFEEAHRDYRYHHATLSDEDRGRWAAAPAVYVEEAYGAQTGHDFIETTKSPGASPFFPFGTGSGGRVFMPPELSLSRLINPNFSTADLTLSTTYQVFYESCVAWGTPILKGTNAGGVADGFSYQLLSSGTILSLEAHDSAGANTTAFKVNNSGDGSFAGSLEVQGGIADMQAGLDVQAAASFNFLKTGANEYRMAGTPTALRTVTWQDASGTVAYTSGTVGGILTTKGDIVRYNASAERLAIGTEGQFLRVSSSSLPEWDNGGDSSHVIIGAQVFS